MYCDCTRFAALGGLLLLQVSGILLAEEPFSVAQLEFFESKVRPVLANRCYQCHSGTKGDEAPKGGLRVDSRQGLLDGGDSGAAIVPGDPESSYLLEAVSYDNVDVQMPPKGKLGDEEVAALATWIRDGAAWPAEQPKAIARKPPFDIAARKAGHWCWQPVAAGPTPKVRDQHWVLDPIDAFVLAKLEAADLAPAGPAAKPVWLRRITFALIGLPPTPDEVAAFVADDAPQAYERVVDRLLASPHFGERWGRHWLDLVRYAETFGHEFDYPIFAPWRYRDYVIRAFNVDVPYDQFVTEHIAGDLMPRPRLHPTDGTNESIIGTGYWFLGEQTHAPVDVLQHQADRIDNQVDVMGKTFLGLTLGCARCHDHKFDAISTKDVYALWGYLQSSRMQVAALDPHGVIADSAKKMAELCSAGSALLDAPPAHSVEPVAIDGDAKVSADSVLFETFDRPGFEGWFVSGEAFGTGPTKPGQWDSFSRETETIAAGMAHSGLLSRKLTGAIRSKSFTVSHDQVWLHAAGNQAKVRLIVDGYMMNQHNSLLFGGLILDLNKDQLNWVAVGGDLKRYRGHRAYLEIVDEGDGYAVVDEIVFANSGPPQSRLPARTQPILLDADDKSRLAQIVAELDALAARLPAAQRFVAMNDGDGYDQPIYIRGNYKNHGDIAPRGFLEAIGGVRRPELNASGSGRLELAKDIADPSNPLTARVMVNRIWHHLFGRGIVATPDNFGVLGQPPTHPELLDHLADRFIREGWSVKQLIRAIVLSNTYRMSSIASERGRQTDPQNKLLHHMPIRRLEGEAIRDAMLAVSGRLDRTQFGPSIPVYLTEFMQGRGRPGGGPRDGKGRRSIYQEIRRNFLPPMMLAFDAPIPFSTVGARMTSNVPAQALTLLNDPFVQDEAQLWAEHMIAAVPTSAEDRIRRMYELAFGRDPTPEELATALEFVTTQATGYGLPAAELLKNVPVWKDLAHVLFNCKEFIFVE